MSPFKFPKGQGATATLAPPKAPGACCLWVAGRMGTWALVLPGEAGGWMGGWHSLALSSASWGPVCPEAEPRGEQLPLSKAK